MVNNCHRLAKKWKCVIMKWEKFLFLWNSNLENNLRDRRNSLEHFELICTCELFYIDIVKSINLEGY